MKKIIAILLALLMILPFAACGNGGTGSSPASAAEEEVADTPAKILRADFRKLADGKTPQEIADELMKNSSVTFAPMVMPVEPGMLTGFGNAEITGFKDGVLFGPAIGTIPFIGYVFELEDGADASAFAENLRSNGDLRWNICTEAEEMLTETVGNKVFFIMAPSSFDEEPME